MLRGAGAGLAHDAREPGAAAFREDDAVGAGTVSAAKDGAQIVGVADLVADEDEGRLAPLRCHGEDVLHRAVFPHGCHRHHALMRPRGTHGAQLPAVGFHHHDTRLPRL